MNQQHGQQEPRFLTVAETSQLVRLGRGAIWKLGRKGLFPKPAHFGGRILWDRRELESWIAEQFAARDSAA